MEALAVGVIISGAALYLGRNIWRSIKGKPNCGSCAASSGCTVKEILHDKNQPSFEV